MKKSSYSAAAITVLGTGIALGDETGDHVWWQNWKVTWTATMTLSITIDHTGVPEEDRDLTASEVAKHAIAGNGYLFFGNNPPASATSVKVGNPHTAPGGTELDPHKLTWNNFVSGPTSPVVNSSEPHPTLPNRVIYTVTIYAGSSMDCKETHRK